MNGIESEQHDEREPRPWWYVTPPPWWSYLFGLLGAVGTAVWSVISNAGSGPALFAHGLVWPGLGIGAVVTIVVWLGWTLDLE